MILKGHIPTFESLHWAALFQYHKGRCTKSYPQLLRGEYFWFIFFQFRLDESVKIVLFINILEFLCPDLYYFGIKFIINIYILYQLVIKTTDEEVLPENYPRPICGQSGCPHSKLPHLQ